MIRYVLFLIFSALVLFTTSGCNPSVGPEITAEDSQVFEVLGRLRSIGSDGKSAVIAHEAVPDYMPAMTMAFAVKNPAELKTVNAGDPLSFRLVVTENDSWIENVRVLENDTLPRSGSDFSRDKQEPALNIGDSVPDFALTNQNGAALRFSDFRGKELLLTFIFVRCPVPNMCPLMSNHFRKLQSLLADSPLNEEVQLLSITIDPEHDTPEVLKNYAAYYNAGPHWSFATGSRPDIDRLCNLFSVFAEPQSGTIMHGLVTARIDREGRLTQVWNGNSWTPEQLFESLDAVQSGVAERSTAESE